MLRHITFTVFITTSMNTLATGMVPETSVLLVDEKRGEASINIKNTDDHPSLLYTTIVDLPESNKSIRLIPTQPVIRVEAGQVQQVRFLLQATVPLQSEELKRVTFEGIPPKDDKSSRVTVSIRQGSTCTDPPGFPAGRARDPKFPNGVKMATKLRLATPVIMSFV